MRLDISVAVVGLALHAPIVMVGLFSMFLGLEMMLAFIPATVGWVVAVVGIIQTRSRPRAGAAMALTAAVLGGGYFLAVEGWPNPVWVAGPVVLIIGASLMVETALRTRSGPMPDLSN